MYVYTYVWNVCMSCMYVRNVYVYVCISFDILNTCNVYNLCVYAYMYVMYVIYVMYVMHVCTHVKQCMYVCVNVLCVCM